MAAAERHGRERLPFALRFNAGQRVRDLESGLLGEVEHAGREERTGWELYRVRLADGRIVFRTDRGLARDVPAARVPEAPRS